MRPGSCYLSGFYELGRQGSIPDRRLRPRAKHLACLGLRSASMALRSRSSRNVREGRKMVARRTAESLVRLGRRLPVP